jgi:16S rRNA (uracil1498-N3)-methyltransferase
MHRFFIFPPDRIDGGGVVIVSDDLLHQIRNVLRFNVSERMVLCDNTGYEYEVEVSQISKNEIVGKLIEKRLNAVEPKLKIALYVGLLKSPERFEFILQKATEVGVTEFIPLITERTEKLSLNKIDRLRRILKEAAEQSGRGVIPVLKEAAKLKDLFKSPVNEDEVNLFATPEAEMSLRRAINKISKVNKINLFVGPEGGFTKKEVFEAEQHGMTIFHLEKRILRTETAAIVIPAVLLSILGQ